MKFLTIYSYPRAVLSVASRDEAVSWTKKFLEAAADGISELHELMDAP